MNKQRDLNRFHVLVTVLGILLRDGDGCVDQQSWCSSNRNFCHLDTMSRRCPLTCDSCLPAECRNCSHNCTVNENGPVQCTCYDGYRLRADGLNCEDIDECAENLLTCADDEVCRNYEGFAECKNRCHAFSRHGYAISKSYKKSCCKQTNGQCGVNQIRSWILRGNVPFSPWQVLIDLNGGRCSGALIDNSWVVSAAHCFENYKVEKIGEYNITAVFGINELDDIVTSVTSQQRRVAEVIIPGDNEFPGSDIALVRLDEAVKRTYRTSPVCLPNGEVPPAGITCYVTGFATSESVLSSKPALIRLQDVNLTIVDDKECRIAHEKSINPVNTTQMLCASSAGIKCNSGGPLVCQRCTSCSWFLAGVYSYSKNCSDLSDLGVFSRVEHFENWIASKISRITVKKEKCQPTHWAEWTKWSRCEGNQTRNRTCLNGMPGIPGCIGASTEARQCSSRDKWSNWSRCSKSCGRGQQSRERVTVHDGSPRITERRACNGDSCPKWTAWSGWSRCANPCGQGQRSRVRACVGGATVKPGCRGRRKQQRTCPIESICSEFGQWTPWTACTRKCGGGSRFAVRRCRGAKWNIPCEGHAERAEPCNTHACCRSHAWSHWSACDKTCGGGSRSRDRGELPCRNLVQFQHCNTGACPEWSDWSGWSLCSKACGGGVRNRTRICGDNLRSASCQGSTTILDACNTEQCKGSCSTLCLQHVKSGHCSSPVRYAMTAFCDPACCTAKFCRDVRTDCPSYAVERCADTHFAGVCLRTCGYCG